jgi:hypothetical protein
MRTSKVRWVIGSILIAAILAGAYHIVRLNRAAMAGTSNTQPSGFYSH